MNEKLLCIYHANCLDGFGSAYVVWKIIGAENVDFHPATHGEPPPDVKGRRVIIVDFSYPRETLLKMAEDADHIIVLDHHKTAQEALQGPLPSNVQVHFDMERSGVGIAWQWFVGELNSTMPQVLAAIEDRDLWRFELPYTKEICAAIASYPQDFEVWDECIRFGLNLRQEGEAILRDQRKKLHEIAKTATETEAIGIKGVPCVNAPYYMASDLGELLGKGKPFVLIYSLASGGNLLKFSLRSHEDGMDVSELAKIYGGGGHKHAAGFTLMPEQVLAGIYQVMFDEKRKSDEQTVK